MNTICLIGNLTADPVVKSFTANAVCRFTLAVRRKYKNSDGDYETDFIEVVAWGKKAELCEKYLKKGNKAGIVGSLQGREFETQTGEKRRVWEVVLEEIEFLSANKTETKAEKVEEIQPVEDSDLPF